MKRYLENRHRINEGIETYSKTSEGKRLKNIALAAIAISIVLLLVSAFFIEGISWKMLLILRGCAGVGAIVFVIAYAILLFRANNQNFQDQINPKR